MKTRTLLALSCLAAATPLAAIAQDKPEGYTCCNLHFDRDWISDANFNNRPFIPAGTKIRVLDYGSNRASVEIDGKPFRIGQDYGRKEESLDKYIHKLVVKGNPKGKIAGASTKVREAIQGSRVIPGMTRDQVIMSVGYPPTHRTPTLEATTWNMWGSNAGRYEIHWKDGKVDRLVGAPWK